MIRLLLTTIMSFSLFGCQPGKIDQIIIGMFANAQESPEAKQTILTQKCNRIRKHQPTKLSRFGGSGLF